MLLAQNIVYQLHENGAVFFDGGNYCAGVIGFFIAKRGDVLAL